MFFNVKDITRIKYNYCYEGYQENYEISAYPLLIMLSFKAGTLIISKSLLSYVATCFEMEVEKNP